MNRSLKASKILGLVLLIIGISLIAYAASLAGNFDIEDHYLKTRGSLMLGFFIAIIGGVLLYPNFKRKN